MTNEQIIKTLESLIESIKGSNRPSKRRTTVILDYGHGGAFIENNEVVYTTAPAKMFKHQQAYQFHQKTLGKHASNTFYEGIFNREQGKVFKQVLQASGFDVIEIVDTHVDISLYERTEQINKLCDNLSNPIVISIHSNGSEKHNADGFSVYTTVGETESDTIAEYVLQSVIDSGLGMKIRLNSHIPKQRDFEANFWILRKTKCPSILIEIGFFDLFKDAIFIDNPENQKAFAEAFTKGIIKYEQQL